MNYALHELRCEVESGKAETPNTGKRQLQTQAQGLLVLEG